MSLSQQCPACIEGDHSGHESNFNGHQPGLIGGVYCDCKGDCTTAFTETVELPRTVVEFALSALGDAWKASVTVQGHLEAPYPDDPRWTPWTRWVHPMATKAWEAKEQLADALRKANHG